MRTTKFYIGINIKTIDGFDNIGKFYIGNNREAVSKIFTQLQGSPKVTEKSMLTLELMETIHNLPINLHLISCTLEELAYNCRTITKEVFLEKNMSELQ